MKQGIFLLILFSFVLFKFGFFKPKQKRYFSGKEIIKFCINDTCYEKLNQKWMVKGKEANGEVIEGNAKRWKDLEIVELISTNKENFTKFGFEERVVFELENKKLIIGNISSDYLGTLVMINDDESRVYKANVIFDKNNLKNEDFWLKKTDLIDNKAKTE